MSRHLTILLLVSVPTLARGQSPPSAEPSTPAKPSAKPPTKWRLRYEPTIDIPVAWTGVIGWVVLGNLQPTFAARQCSWCSSNAVDRGVRELRWSNSNAASVLSDFSAFGAVPVVMAGIELLGAWHEHHLGQFPVDLLIMVEAAGLTGVVTQIVRYAVARERPFVHALALVDKERTADPFENNTSFFSGHTSFAFSVVTSAATVASVRGYHIAGWIWGIGVPLALFTGYTRIAADKHYLSDVLVGAAVGAGIGFATAYLHALPAFSRLPAKLSAAPMRDGAMLSLGVTW